MPHHSENEDLNDLLDSEPEDNGDSSDDDIIPPPPPVGQDDSDDDDDANSLVSDDGVKPPPPTTEQEDSDDDVNSLISDDDEPRNSAMEVGVNEENTDFLHSNSNYDNDMNDYSDDDDDDDENYLQKLDSSLKTNVISEHHPELKVHNNEEVEALSRVVRNEQGVIVDSLHLTVPILTKYERARILGERAKQLNMGAKPVVPIPDNVIDGYLIALEEFNHKKIPFIVKRPLPNGGCEYWKLQDLEII